MNRLSLLFITLATATAAHAELSWANKDKHYGRNDKIATEVTDTTLTAWRGERVNALALLTVSGTEDAAVTARLTGPIKGEAKFLDYVLTDSYRRCGTHPDNLEAYEVPDIIGDASTVVKGGESRPVWVSVDVPLDIKAGTYTDTLAVDGQSLLLTLNVEKRTLPEAKDRAFYLNLWQQPYAISRYYNVEPWSAEHFKLMEPYAEMLARAGQRAISAILIFEPWGEQSNDLFHPMVETYKNADGTWSYDYRIFDRWVEFMTAHGVGPDIECFSMIPWDMSFRYINRATGEYEYLKTKTGTSEYRDFWGNFIKNFYAHLKEKGWENRAMIAMDERPMPDMRNAIAVIDSVAPEMKVSLAGNYHPEVADRLYSLTITQGDMFPPGVVKERSDKGQVTLLYTCCSSPEPNLFSNSEPADATWLPVHCTETGHDGYLHWSWSNWTDDPMKDSRFKLFAPGDTYFIYPDAKSSVRFERLIEGIELSEKIRILREELVKSKNTKALSDFDNALSIVAFPKPVRAASTAKQVNYLNDIVKTYGSTKKKK